MKILIKGAGDLATGIAHELFHAGHEILMTEIQKPLTVRRKVAYSRVVYEEKAEIEGIEGALVRDGSGILKVTEAGKIAVIVDEKAEVRKIYKPDVLVDAIMAKRNTGTSIEDAPLVIGIGPGFCAGEDCHYVIETQRGESLGKIIPEGRALPDTGIPGEVGGYTAERLIRAEAGGMMTPFVEIGDLVEKGQCVAVTGGIPVYAGMSGIVRGMLPEGTVVSKGLKIGDIDARRIRSLCYTISDKSRCIGKSVKKVIKEENPLYK